MTQDVTASGSRQDRFAGRICTSNLKQQLKVRIRPIVVVLVMLLFIIQTHATLTANEQTTPQAPPEVHTLWTGMNAYTGADKSTRLLNSFAVGYMHGCRGTLIAPHIFMTAAHCGNPDYVTRTVTFFRIDEDTLSGPNSQTTGDSFQARPLPWRPLLDPSDRQYEDIRLWWLDNGRDGVPPGNKYGYLALSAEEVTGVNSGAFVAAFDAIQNNVADLIEYDLFLTPAVRDFYHLSFATPLQRAQWQPAPAATSSTAAGPALQVGHIGGKLIGPFAYRTAADSPFHNQDLIPHGSCKFLKGNQN